MAEMVPDGQGGIRYIQIPDPGAGLNFTYAQPIRTRWWLKNITAVFTAGAAAANREAALEILQGGNRIMIIRGGESIVAAEVWYLNWGGVLSAGLTAAGRIQTMNIPERTILNDVVIVQSMIVNIQPADVISDIFMIVEEWIEPLV